MGNLINGIILLKMKFAIAALLGLAAARTTLFTTQGQVAYVEEDDESAALQLDDWHPGQHETLGASAYERVTPERFSGDSDDIFMRSMIQNYAIEKNCAAPKADPVACGNFVMNKVTMRAAAGEVLATHKGLTGDKLQSYLATYFDKSFGHFDVNQTGEIEVMKAPQFMRFLASDQYMSLQCAWTSL